MAGGDGYGATRAPPLRLAPGPVLDADPSFSVSFTDLLESDESYQVHYWIDSNFGGGDAGACDGPATDHQWEVAIGSVDEDATHTEDHRPSEIADVCSTFADA